MNTPSARAPLAWLLVLPLLSTTLVAQSTTRASVDSYGAQSDLDSKAPSLSADGRYIAFSSLADDLVAGDTNGFADVFVHDRLTGVTTRVSVDSSGGQANGDSESPSLSGDGKLVTFNSYATNLVTGDANGNSDVFVHDLESGITVRVSVTSQGVEGNGASVSPSMSRNGRFVTFVSWASNFFSGDNQYSDDIFVHDLVTATTTLVSCNTHGDPGNDSSKSPCLSADGRFVAFASAATNLVASDTNGSWDVFLRDRQTSTTTRLSVDSQGNQGNDDSGYWCSFIFCVPEGVAISDDGRFVAFGSAATNLVPGDSNGADDVFLRDVIAGTTSRVSLSSQGGQGHGNSKLPALSSDGRFVAFVSWASDLVAGDLNGYEDIFLCDRQSGATTRMSVDSQGNESNGKSYWPAISGDGQFVAFESTASNLVPLDTNGFRDIFVRDLRGVPTHALAIRSEPGHLVPIDVAPPDVDGRAGGDTDFTRIYDDGTPVTLTAPLSLPPPYGTARGAHFERWVIDGVGWPLHQNVATVTVTKDRTAIARYR
jgi:Tol biopolymer transport system component